MSDSLCVVPYSVMVHVIFERNEFMMHCKQAARIENSSCKQPFIYTTKHSVMLCKNSEATGIQQIICHSHELLALALVIVFPTSIRMRSNASTPLLLSLSSSFFSLCLRGGHLCSIHNFRANEFHSIVRYELLIISNFMVTDLCNIYSISANVSLVIFM